MSEDTPVNIGVAWPAPNEADLAVRSMQTKLHRWASADRARRFGDLYNLVYDPAFLVTAWQRVRTNVGSRTPGIDRVTVTFIETRVGEETFLHYVREQLKARAFIPVEVRQVMIPKASGKLRKLGIPTVTDRVVQAGVEAGARTDLRGGLPALLVRVPPDAAGAGCGRRDPAHDHPRLRVGAGGRYPGVFRSRRGSARRPTDQPCTWTSTSYCSG